MAVFYTRHYLLLCFQGLVFVLWGTPVKGHCGFEFSSGHSAHWVLTAKQCCRIKVEQFLRTGMVLLVFDVGAKGFDSRSVVSIFSEFVNNRPKSEQNTVRHSSWVESLRPIRCSWYSVLSYASKYLVTLCLYFDYFISSAPYGAPSVLLEAQFGCQGKLHLRFFYFSFSSVWIFSVTFYDHLQGIV